MTRKNISTVAIALSALFAGQAIAATTDASTVSRAQVQAELADAVRSGQIFDNAQDTMLNRAYPQRYAGSQAVAGKTRAQVQAELAEAVRSGQIFDAAADTTLRNAYPGRY